MAVVTMVTGWRHHKVPKSSKSIYNLKCLYLKNDKSFFKSVFDIWIAKRIIFRKCFIRFLKISNPESLQRVKNVKNIFFDFGAPYWKCNVIMKITDVSRKYLVWGYYVPSFKLIPLFYQKLITIKFWPNL